GQLAAFDRSVLETRLGEHGTDIWQRANGIDGGEVQSEHAPTSVGHSHTFDANTLDTAKIESTLLRLSEGVGRRLRDHTLRGRTITMTLRVAPFETRTRQRTLREPTDDDVTIFRIARQLLRSALAEDRECGRTRPVTLVGGCGEVCGQIVLFADDQVTMMREADKAKGKEGVPEDRVAQVAIDFISFCLSRRAVDWPFLYDEMCYVASNRLYRGLGYEELREV